ncbi:MAG: isopentenyl-diphosphate delta-isomerase [Flavobacteriales bacterium]|jgi:isopentenyl-diphosphate delta-isomerase
MNEEVILVDEFDNEIGTMEKLEAHVKGELHRAFSIFIFNLKGELLLQQRALHKYHSAGLWTNTCCSHQRANESSENAAKRRLVEEMGMHSSLEEAFTFIYKSEFDNDLTEHEFDHVFIGEDDSLPQINTDEVATSKYISIPHLIAEIERAPEKFTTWFRICLPRVIEFRNKA